TRAAGRRRWRPAARKASQNGCAARIHRFCERLNVGRSDCNAMPSPSLSRHQQCQRIRHDFKLRRKLADEFSVELKVNGGFTLSGAANLLGLDEVHIAQAQMLADQDGGSVK